MDILGMDILGWDCPASSGNFAEKFAEHDPNADNSSYDLWELNSYDLWELNCCVVCDAYWRGDTSLWNRVLSFI